MKKIILKSFAFMLGVVTISIAAAGMNVRASQKPGNTALYSWAGTELNYSKLTLLKR